MRGSKRGSNDCEAESVSIHSPHTVHVRHYRSTQYFLEDQLRCSEAVSEFRTVKNLVGNLPAFSLRSQLEFAVQSVAAEYR